MKDQTYYNLVAGAVALGIVTLLVVWTGMVATTGAQGNAGTTSTGGPAQMYLTIQMNPNTGMPQYSPANFSVPLGPVVFTIYDFDSVVDWAGCQCNVTGTVGNVETVNGTAMSLVPSSNAAHTFTVGALGLNVVSPGNSTTVFEVDFTTAGVYTWICLDPCGSDGYSGAPMGEAGYMTGTMTVG
jgi:hypothetical protein